MPARKPRWPYGFMVITKKDVCGADSMQEPVGGVNGGVGLPVL